MQYKINQYLRKNNDLREIVQKKIRQVFELNCNGFFN